MDRPAYRDLTEWVVLKVIDGIRAGAFLPGERLMADSLAQRFGVSCAPVRDAIHRLENLGIVEPRPRRGACIRPWALKDRAEAQAILDGLLRVSVELAVSRLTQLDFDELDRMVASVRQSVEAHDRVPDLVDRDGAFHRVITVASGNRRLVDLIDTSGLPLRVNLRPEDFYAPDQWLEIHSGLLDTLKTRDPRAVMARFHRNKQETVRLFYGPRRASTGQIPGRKPAAASA